MRSNAVSNAAHVTGRDLAFDDRDTFLRTDLAD
jgi:hypothetical protein